ncbi:Vacuolar protein sorting-associated protein 68 [Malassezia cuniculi]|uniref:Vacuolar protein sorting-associated protein 68 n=1 Tax=Malassezia cuniculi TaxID=948313 RepID=A0AAF0J6C4_9BASI|nr:Vacuolar protein sorting-associated protein 68 [Malassezia cuniculi]
MHHGDETRRVFRVRLPSLPASLRPNRRSLCVYASGALFALGWWFFFDACIRSHQIAADGPSETLIQGVDWVPGTISTIGLIIVNIIDKQHLMDSDGSIATGAWGATDPVQWRTRLWLFVGFACLAGGMAGSMALSVVKYTIPSHAGHEEFGFANVVQNASIMASAVLLWISQRTESEYEYNLTL